MNRKNITLIVVIGILVLGGIFAYSMADKLAGKRTAEQVTPPPGEIRTGSAEDALHNIEADLGGLALPTSSDVQSIEQDINSSF